MKVDAIVNPTNTRLSSLGSIDLRVHQAGQEALEDELNKIGICSTGDAILTNGHNLPCKYVIHTVVPMLNSDVDAIESCYQNCLRLATICNIKSVAFPLITTGSLDSSTDKTIQIAINSINSFLLDYDLNVYLVVNNSETFGVSKELVDCVKSYIDNDTIEDEQIVLIQHLLSCYEFNDNSLTNRTIGEIKVSDSIQTSFKGNYLYFCDSCCEKECCNGIEEHGLEGLIPELKKITETSEDSFTYKLFKIIDDNKFKDSDVYNAAGISKMVFSNLRKGVIPKKKTVLKFCLTLPINIEQAKDLLASAGYAFVLSNKFEKTIKKIIEAKNTKKLIRIDVIDLILYELGLPVFNTTH